ncbi:YbaK/EbsC family protein [bacterium]|nr:YbaK/EbsC family protein [bacterium]
MACAKLFAYLTDRGVDFTVKEHPNAFAAQDVAFKSGVPGRLFAKTVMVKIDGEMAMAVLPADSRIDFHLLRETARADTICLATEQDFDPVFPDCELGAMPPFGNLYGMRVFVAGSLIRTDLIAFNAGSHTEVITMPFWQFEKLVEPTIGYFTYRRLQERQGSA